MAFGDVVKSVIARFSVENFEETKAAIKDLGAAADDASKSINLGASLDDGSVRGKLDLLKVQFRQLQQTGVGSFRDISAAASDLGDKLTTNSMKAELLALQLRMIKYQTDQNTGPNLLRRLVGGTFGSGLGGLLGGTGAGAGAGIPFVGGTLGAIGPAGAFAGLGILGGTGILGIIPALLSALAGVGSFGALAYPTISGILSGNSSYAAAISNYQTASANLSTAINQSAADQKAYQATLQNTEPDLRNAAGLLTNQNVQWQNLSPSMQNSLTALRDNSAAYKILLPDQQKALNALLAERNAWNGLTPLQQVAIGQLQKLSGTFDGMVAKVEPLAGKVVDLSLQLGTKLLPVVGQFANAAGPAVVKLFQQLDNAAGSPQFKNFVDQMVRLSGPTLTAAGQGLFQVSGALSNVALASVKVNDQTKILTIALDALAGSLNTIAFLASASAAALKGIIGFLGWLLGGSGGAPLGAGLPSVGSINPALGNLGGLTPGGSYGTGSTYSPLPAWGPGQKTAPVNVNIHVTGSGPFVTALKQSIRVRGGNPGVTGL